MVRAQARYGRCMRMCESLVIPRDVSSSILASCMSAPMGPCALRTLCDEIGGRLSGTESGRQAEEWACETFRGIGLDDVYFEELAVPVWERGELELSVTGRSGWKLRALSHGFSPMCADLTGPVVDVGHGLPEDFNRAGHVVRDAIVLCDEGAPDGKRVPHRTEKLGWAVEHGAQALLIGSNAAGCLPRTGVCHRSGSPIPSVGISFEDMMRLRRHLSDGIRPVMRIHMTNTIYSGTARNVFADVRGLHPSDGLVLVGAHLDAWDVAQGATDNGLGCAIVLQIAASLLAIERPPRRTIRFALWAAEETGLRGSRHYVAHHAEELDHVVALLNFDMTGDPYGFVTPGRPQEGGFLQGLARQLEPLGMAGQVATSVSLHSDHEPFLLRGVPVVGVASRHGDGSGAHYYHTEGDTFEKVSVPALCRAATVAAHLVWALADMPERPWPRASAREVHDMLETAGLLEALSPEDRLLNWASNEDD